MRKNKKNINVIKTIEDTMNELFEDNIDYIKNINDYNISIVNNNNNNNNNNKIELNINKEINYTTGTFCENNDDKNNKYKICEICNFKTLSTSALIKHLETNKHKNKINPISTKCSYCGYEGKNKWNLNLHIKSQHTNKDNKNTIKYYCKLCDTVFFCEKYLLKHNEGKKHNNNIKLNQLINNNIDNSGVSNNLINN